MASTLLSPGVEIQERDLTLGSIETVEVNVGAIAGPFAKGPVLSPVRITTESQLLDTFGEPSDATAATWWPAARFLSYGGVLDVVRCALLHLLEVGLVRCLLHRLHSGMQEVFGELRLAVEVVKIGAGQQLVRLLGE